MSYGKRSAWQRPHDAAYSSRAPSVERAVSDEIARGTTRRGSFMR